MKRVIATLYTCVLFLPPHMSHLVYTHQFIIVYSNSDENILISCWSLKEIRDTSFSETHVSLCWFYRTADLLVKLGNRNEPSRGFYLGISQWIAKCFFCLALIFLGREETTTISSNLFNRTYVNPWVWRAKNPWVSMVSCELTTNSKDV